MSERDLQRWTREVAEDPGAPSFVRLARAYRRQGRREAALDVVVRGLESNPEHVDAHSLLALLHVEEGDRERARDEWETVLTLDPGHFDASRGLGFLALERNDLKQARRHLDAARRGRPDDTTVAQARQLLDQRLAAARATAAAALAAPASQADLSAQPDRDGERRDPRRLFEALRSEGPFLGALALDEQGLVLAGELEGEAGDSNEFLGGLLSAVVDEARRTVELVGMGEWVGLVVESEHVTFHLSPLAPGVLVVATPPRTPAGWVLRVAALARRAAAGFMERSP
jgi:tetratricopeptide (TPR) repeat protein